MVAPLGQNTGHLGYVIALVSSSDLVKDHLSQPGAGEENVLYFS